MPGFEIDFARTPFSDGRVGAAPNRLNWRAELLLHRNRHLIDGKRVLDLACTDGRFSYACLKLGASKVTGVEGRPEQVEQANAWFSELDLPKGSWSFTSSDLFDYLPQCEPKSFDTILCFGFFYHTMRQVELMQQFQRLAPEHLIMDTTVMLERRWIRPARMLWRLRPHHLLSPSRLLQLWESTEGDEVMYFKTEEAEHPSGTIERNFWARAEWEKGHEIGANLVPTESMVERLFDVHGFEWRHIEWDGAPISDWTALEDYKSRQRVSYLATPRQLPTA